MDGAREIAAVAKFLISDKARGACGETVPAYQHFFGQRGK
jgi:hypothetical protein